MYIDLLPWTNSAVGRQVVVAVSPAPLRQELVRRFLTPQITALARHPRANFVVQAALAAVQTPEEVRTYHAFLEGTEHHIVVKGLIFTQITQI